MKTILSLIIFILSTGIASAQKNELYELETKNTSMIFSGKPGGKFMFQHYGVKLDDPSQLLKGGTGVNVEAYPAFGLHCDEEKALRVTHSDGNLSADLYIKNIEFTEEDANSILMKVSLYDDKYPFYVDLFYKAYYNEDIIEIWNSIRHEEKKPVTLYRFATFAMTVQSDDAWLTHFHGNWADEYNLAEEKILRGVKEIRNREGVRNARHDSPFFMLSVDGQATETSGNVIGATLAWTGTYRFSFNHALKHNIEILAGMNEDASHYLLEKNEVFETPKLYISYSDQGKGQISRNFHRWAREHYMIAGKEERKILLNSWEGVYFDVSEKDMLGMIDDIAEMGGEMFVMDDGWFGDKYPRDNEKTSLGDWMINTRKLPNGLTPLIDRAEEKGIIFGIWLEPEMVNVKSELYEAHPDWVVKQPNREIVKGRGGSQMLLDLSNPEVQDFIYNTIHDLLVEYPQIGYIKWDANHFISNVGSTFLPDDKQSHLYIEYHRGLQKTLDRIRKDHPDIIMQACASGGGRMNYGYLPWFHEFWTSDVTDAVKRVSIQWGASHFFPAMVQGSHVSPSPNHQTGRLLPLKFRCDVAMTGRFGLEMQPKDLNEEDKERTRTTIETYMSIRPVIQMGDQYRLISPYDESGLTSTMYVTPEKDRAVFFAFTLKDNLNPKFPPVKLNGLDPDKKYKLTEINKIDPDGRNFPGDNQKFRGKFLMDVGIQVNLRGVYTSRVIELTEVK